MGTATGGTATVPEYVRPALHICRLPWRGKETRPLTPTPSPRNPPPHPEQRGPVYFHTASGPQTERTAIYNRGKRSYEARKKPGRHRVWAKTLIIISTVRAKKAKCRLTGDPKEGTQPGSG